MRLRELDQETWPALERLFGPNGAVAGCWCTWFFQTNKDLAENGSAGNAGCCTPRCAPARSACSPWMARTRVAGPFAGAVEHARRNGANAIEGYPVNTELDRASKIGS